MTFGHEVSFLVTCLLGSCCWLGTDSSLEAGWVLPGVCFNSFGLFLTSYTPAALGHKWNATALRLCLVRLPSKQHRVRSNSVITIFSIWWALKVIHEFAVVSFHSDSSSTHMGWNKGQLQRGIHITMWLPYNLWWFYFIYIYLYLLIFHTVTNSIPK